ncbi:hypothetical protein A4A49_32306 [Nicotiana attenuata]|uniref:Uncharacterized protein n=1 Tax=Nicotiana attenuata TaxID=49451 RepID=A0A1J6JBA8_NICAT|nr:hypothetical protein A4A49_32306 [Nicotiana attenuata]
MIHLLPSQSYELRQKQLLSKFWVVVEFPDLKFQQMDSFNTNPLSCHVLLSNECQLTDNLNVVANIARICPLFPAWSDLSPLLKKKNNFISVSDIT